ncbi:MAG: deoxyribonuclease IV [Thermoproteota archaeon]
MKLGLHLSIRGSIDRVINRALERHCETFQMFSRNPRAWRSRKLDPEEVENFKEKLRISGIYPVIIHTPYLLNLASPKEEVFLKSIKALKEELRRAAILNIPYVVTHLGSHLGKGKKEGFSRIVEAVNKSISEVQNKVVLLLENTAGTRNSMGSDFDDIGHILSKIRWKDRVGVCFDTCHAFAAGYDLISRSAVKDTLRKFDQTIGFQKLKLVHLNDSKGDLASGIDRHEHIGMGKIGEIGFRNILHSKLVHLPLILETPVDNRRSDLENLEKVRELASS